MAKSALSLSVSLYNKSQKALMTKKWPPCNQSSFDIVHSGSWIVPTHTLFRLFGSSIHESTLHSHKSLHSPQSLKLVKPVKEKMYRTQTHVTVQVYTPSYPTVLAPSLCSSPYRCCKQSSHMLKEQPRVTWSTYHKQVKIHKYHYSYSHCAGCIIILCTRTSTANKFRSSNGLESSCYRSKCCQSLDCSQ